MGVFSCLKTYDFIVKDDFFNVQGHDYEDFKDLECLFAASAVNSVLIESEFYGINMFFSFLGEVPLNVGQFECGA